MTSEGLLLKEGRYRLEGKLGSGGMGSVWRAADLTLRRTVALKELAHPAGLGERRESAVREARALAAVSHPAIVTIHDIFFERSDPWIVMDYIRGQSLAALMQERELSQREIARIGLPVLHGLSAAHGRGVIHRDVKPANILVTDAGQVFLVDFGIARIAGDLTITGQRRLVGTPEFLAPEQLRGQHAGSAADLWSLGVTFFCALEGYSPFRRQGDRPDEATMMAIVYEQAPPLRAEGPLAEIVARLLRKDPASRPDAAELGSVLRAIAEETRPARPPRQPPSPRAAPLQARQRQVPPPLPPAPEAAPEPARLRPAARRPAPDEPATLPARARQPVPPPVPAGQQQAGPDQAGPDQVRLREDRERIRQAGPQAGAALLARMSAQRAATIIASFPATMAGALISGIAADQPQLAGEVLRMLCAGPARGAINHVASAAAAAALAAVPVALGARILGPASPRTAAAVIRELPSGISVQLVRAMPGPRAARVLHLVEPAIVAGLLTMTGEVDEGLLALLSPQFREQVMRYLPPDAAAS